MGADTATFEGIGGEIGNILAEFSDFDWVGGPGTGGWGGGLAAGGAQNYDKKENTEGERRTPNVELRTPNEEGRRGIVKGRR